MPPRLLRALLPILALGLFAFTLHTCFSLARGAGHLDVYDQMGWRPVISFFGDEEPERAAFRRGFSALAAVLAVTLAARSLQLAKDPSVKKAWLRRVLVVASGVTAIASLLVMTWIPDNVSPLHFFAALATFFFLSVWELLEATLMVTAFRVRGFRAHHALQLLWSFGCPLASCAFVAKWITNADVGAQYLAVGLQFAWFLGAIPELARAPSGSSERDIVER